MCEKRRAAILPHVILMLEQHKEISLDSETRRKQLTISPATIDRLLAPERKKMALRGRSGTRPGAFLKHQVPIRTFAEWDEVTPRFVEIDLVCHDVGVALGDCCQTIYVSDAASGGTETQGVMNKAPIWVVQALKDI